MSSSSYYNNDILVDLTNENTALKAEIERLKKVNEDLSLQVECLQDEMAGEDL